MGRPHLLRTLNDRTALDLLAEHGPLTRTRIGALTGLSKPTASQLVDRLQAAGLVVPAGVVSADRPGPNAQLYAVNPGAGYAGGVDVTRDLVTASVVDLAGTVVGEFAVPVVGRTAAGGMERVRDALQGAADAASLAVEAVQHVVIGVPAAPHPETGALGFARHLPGWHGGNVTRLRSLLGTGIELENDVNLAAIAEQHYGQAKGADDYVVLWIGDGIGMAIVQDGRFVRGASGGAGEIGYMPVALDPEAGTARQGSKPRSPARNTFQNAVGRLAVLSLATEHGLRAHDPGSAVRLAMAAGDLAFLARLARRIACGLAPVIAVLDPAQLVLSGQTLRAGGDRLKDLIDGELRAAGVSPPTLDVSTVRGNAVLAGALRSSLETVRRRLFTLPH